MAFQTLDLPSDLMDRVAAAALVAEMDVDAYIAKALTFALHEYVAPTSGNGKSYAVDTSNMARRGGGAVDTSNMARRGGGASSATTQRLPFKERPPVFLTSVPDGAASVHITINATNTVTLQFTDKDGLTIAFVSVS